MHFDQTNCIQLRGPQVYSDRQATHSLLQTQSSVATPADLNFYIFLKFLYYFFASFHFSLHYYYYFSLASIF